MTYEDTLKNQSLNNYLEPYKASFEELVESAIMDSEGITINELKQQLASRWSENISKREVEDCIRTINRKYVSEISKQMIVFDENNRYHWRGRD